MRAYSIDLREKIVESVKRGVPKSETARRFGVDRATVKRYCKRLDEHGTMEPGRRAPAKAPKLAGREGEEATRERPPREIVGHPLSEDRVSDRHGGGEGERSDDLPGSKTPLTQSKKRSRGAAERDEFLRLLWRMEVGCVDPGRLVFVDELGTHTSLAPLYAYAPVGERGAFFKIPRNRGTNTTLLFEPPSEQARTFHGRRRSETTREVFETYVEHFLAPALKPGQVVVMDNLGAHRPKKVRELIEGEGCELLYLTPYSPDLNPIEEAFSKVKHILRKKIGPRTKEVNVSKVVGLVFLPLRERPS